MARVVTVWVSVAVVAGVLGIDAAAQRAGGAAAGQKAVRRETPKYACPAVTGVGINTKRRYCDVRIADVVEDGIRIELPPRIGAATVRFDLHSRFSVGRTIALQRHDAVVALVDPEGRIVARAAVRGELRVARDLFDRLTAIGSRTRIAAAPGRPEKISASVPAGTAFVALVGSHLDVQLPSKFERIETVGRPIAIASNFDISYTPAAR
jgi:hypothetical protein